MPSGEKRCDAAPHGPNRGNGPLSEVESAVEWFLGARHRPLTVFFTLYHLGGTDMTHRAQNLIAALAIATFATGAFAQLAVGPGPDGIAGTADDAALWTDFNGAFDSDGGNPGGFVERNGDPFIPGVGTYLTNDDAWTTGGEVAGDGAIDLGLDYDGDGTFNEQWNPLVDAYGGPVVDRSFKMVSGMYDPSSGLNGPGISYGFAGEDLSGLPGGGVEWRSGQYAAGATAGANVGVTQLANGNQALSISAGYWGGWGAAVDLEHYLYQSQLVVDVDDVDGDGHIMEFSMGIGSQNWENGDDPNRGTITIDTGSTNPIEWSMTVDTSQTLYADETDESFLGNPAGHPNPDTQNQKENMRWAYHPMTVTWDDGAGNTGSTTVGLGKTLWGPAQGATFAGGFWNKEGIVDYFSLDVDAASDVAMNYDTTPDFYAVSRAGDADRDGDVDFTENPLGGGDGNSDLNILNNNAGTTTGATWAQGDFDDDGDVDFTENPLGGGDGQSDLNILNSNAGTSYSDLGEDNAGGTGTAELVYDYATGKVWIETADATINTIELFTDGSTLVIDTGAVGNLNGSAPNDLNSSALQYFVSSGLPTGESLIGQILPGNLTEGDVVLGTNLLFRFARAGEAPQSGVVTLIPEPTSIALLGLGGLALLRRRRA